jgi:hypothetical protein
MSLISWHALFPVVHFRTTRRTLKHRSVVEKSTTASSTSSPALDATFGDISQFTVVLDEADYLREEAAEETAFRVAEVELMLESPTVRLDAEAAACFGSGSLSHTVSASLLCSLRRRTR